MIILSLAENNLLSIRNLFSNGSLGNISLSAEFQKSRYIGTPGGWGVLPYMGYIGTCRGIGYGF